MKDKRQLLCTFSSLRSFKYTIEDLKKYYTIYNNKFFVFSNVNDSKDIFITYNILKDGNVFPKFPNTISIHRKKHTNTLYTLNAMNQLIKDENDGIFDKSYSVKWELYKDTLIIIGELSVKVLPIKIVDIIS